MTNSYNKCCKFFNNFFILNKSLGKKLIFIIKLIEINFAFKFDID